MIQQLFTDIPVSNIFRHRIDWYVRAMTCKKPLSKDNFIKDVAAIITRELEISPFASLDYRERRHVQSRQILLTMLYNYSSKTLDNIGKVLCKDHATVLHAVRTVNNQCETDKRFKAMYDRIDNKVKHLKQT